MNIKCFLLIPTDKTVERKGNYSDGSGEFTSWDPIYKRSDTGEETTLNAAPVGAIWENTWYEEHGLEEWCGPDGKSFTVRTPGGDWCTDSRASNCTKPDDKIHKCWCRHGEAPNLTVNKVGNTCSAGAGSILIGGYHGFLTNGELTCC